MSQALALPLIRITDSNGAPISGAKAYFYLTGTTTPQSVYTSSALSVAHANPVVCNSAGIAAPIFLDPTKTYRLVATDADDNAIDRWDIDPINGNGSSNLQFAPGLTDAVTRTVEAKLRERVSLLDFIPTTYHAGIQDRSGTTDLSEYIQNAFDAVPAGAEIYAPYGTYRMASGVSASRSITLVGDPAQENFDNSWDTGIGGTVFDYRGTTGDAFTFTPPNATNSRINVCLRHFSIRHSRLTNSGTSGSCLYVNGRLLAGSFVRLDMEDVHCCEAPHHGIFITGEVYGGIINDIFCHRNGYNGFRADGSVGPAGEMVLGRIRCFQNGQDSGGTQQQTANFLWLGGTVFIDMLSASESANGPGVVLGGGPINIGHLQLESNSEDDSLIIGQNGVGVTALTIGSYMIAPGTGYTHSHIHITQYLTGRVVIGPGYHADTLGVGGLHLERDSSAGQLSWNVSPASFATTVAIDDNATSYDTRFPLSVFARDAAGLTDATGDGTDVTWKPGTEVFDTWGAYNSSTGVFTAPISGLYEVDVQIPLSGASAGHDRSSVAFVATTYSRLYNTGNIENVMNATGVFTLTAKAVIPMLQGETCSVTFNVGGGTKTVDTTANAAYASISIRSVG